MAVCERCPSPGACAVCPAVASFRRLQTIDFGQANVRVIGGTKEISFKKSPKLGESTLYVFDSGGRRGSEAPIPINEFVSNEVNKLVSKETRTSEKTCSECGQSASNCRCVSKAA